MAPELWFAVFALGSEFRERRPRGSHLSLRRTQTCVRKQSLGKCKNERVFTADVRFLRLFFFFKIFCSRIFFFLNRGNLGL